MKATGETRRQSVPTITHDVIGVTASQDNDKKSQGLPIHIFMIVKFFFYFTNYTSFYLLSASNLAYLFR